METQEKQKVDLVETYPSGDYHPPEDCVWSDYLNSHILADKSISVITNTDGDFDYILSDDTSDFIFVEDEDCKVHVDATWDCYASGNAFFNIDYRVETYCGHIVHDEYASGHDFIWCEHGVADGYWIDDNDACYCEDIDGYVIEADAHWCEHTEAYYYDEDEVGCPSGPEHINEYHTSRQMVTYKAGATHSDFRIGFEIEKNLFRTEDHDAESRGDHVGYFDLIAGFETDSSCGVEAVTHILPLASPRSQRRKVVFDMIDEATCIVDSPYDNSCGGHMTITVRDINDGYDIVDKLRQKIALLYALYRHRLKRSYCEHNKPAKKESNYKYSPVHVKSNKVEFRIPSAIRNTKQLKLRYDLMWKMMYYTFKRPIGFEEYLKRVRPIIKRMYSGNERKVDIIYNIARDFRRYLIAEEVTDLTDQFINNKTEE